MLVYPNSRNVIPGRVFFTIDFRHPDEDILSAMDADLRDATSRIAGEIGLELAFEQIWHAPALAFDPGCVNTVRNAAVEAGYPHRDIVSGAGHDSCHIARVTPTGMIFVPCAKGISHNEEESATPEDLAAGCQILLQAIIERANMGPTKEPSG
jgi:N-carbamoyl-L-amino-acid hydrolase